LRRRLRSLPLALCLALSAAAALPPAAVGGGPTLEQQLQEQMRSLDALHARMDATERALAGDRARVAALGRKVDLAREKVATQQRYVGTLVARLNAAQARLQATLGELEANRTQLARDRSLLDLHVRGIYEEGTVGLLSVLLRAHSFSDFLTRFAYLEAIVADNVRLLRQVQADRRAIRLREAAARQQAARLADVEDEASVQLDVLRSEERAALAARSRAQAAAAREADQVAAEARAARQVTDLIRSTRLAIFRRGHGGFALIWPVRGPITDPFGYRFHPIFHYWELHTGIDIGVPEGTPIHAAEDGVVTFVGWLTGDGNTTIIDDGEVGGHDVSTVYAHQSRFAVREGERVVQGQVIGYVGMTGWATGPHLHFEVRVDDKPVNPADWLP
jgi:murein DD-endopeptidase MepM/ murein hydrolase activator NlpD